MPAQPRPVLVQQGRGRLWLAQLQGLLQQVVAKYFALPATRSGSLNLCLSAASCCENREIGVVIKKQTHRIHGAGIYANINGVYQV